MWFKLFSLFRKCGPDGNPVSRFRRRAARNGPYGLKTHLEYLEERTLLSGGLLAMSFEPNLGQTSAEVQFLSRGDGYTLFLTPSEAVLSLTPSDGELAEDRDTADASVVLRMQLIGVNANAQVVGVDQLPGKANYFLGNDPAQWRTNISTYAKVQYQDVYAGIDLVYYGNQRQLEYDFVVSPGADPNVIGLSFTGAERVEIGEQGDLVLHIGSEQILQHQPVIYQETNGTRQRITGGYVLLGAQQVGFQVGPYDHTRPLVIDPLLAYSTYLGGNGTDRGLAPAVDHNGNVYVTGETSSNNFPTMNPVQPARGGGLDAFVTKLNAAGSAVVYSTYLGGGADESGLGIAVDDEGNAYVSGRTASANFPTSHALQSAYGGGLRDAFVVKLNADGSALAYSTFLGGSDNDVAFDLRLDASANAYVSGSTSSTNFPTANPLQAANAGGTDIFVTKLNSSGSQLVYSTYLGGSGSEGNGALAVDDVGNAYVAGRTPSTNFPTANAVQPTYGGDPNDAFVAKLNAAGSALVYSTYLGGSGNDPALAVAVDPFGNTSVTGRTSSTTNFPIVNAVQPTYGGGPNDAFVAKLNAAGSALVYSSYLGGSSDENAFGLAADAAGHVNVSGWTSSTNFPTDHPLQGTYGGGISDAFLTRLNADGSALDYSTYLGGSGEDKGDYVVVDAGGSVYMTGWTSSTNFAITSGAFQPVYAGGAFDAFVLKIPLEPQEALVVLEAEVARLVDSGVLNEGQGHSLSVKLQHVRKHLDRQNTQTAANELRAFRNQLEAFSQSGILSPFQRDRLDFAAGDILGRIEDVS